MWRHGDQLNLFLQHRRNSTKVSPRFILVRFKSKYLSIVTFYERVGTEKITHFLFRCPLRNSKNTFVFFNGKWKSLPPFYPVSNASSNTFKRSYSWGGEGMKKPPTQPTSLSCTWWQFCKVYVINRKIKIIKWAKDTRVFYISLYIIS